jgi:hypothetical protein
MQPSVDAEGKQGGDGEHRGKERKRPSVRIARPSRSNGAWQIGKADQSLQMGREAVFGTPASQGG